MPHFVSMFCRSEKCSICKKPATHKVAEEMSYDDPHPLRYSLSAYVCCEHFCQIMGKSVMCSGG